MAICTTRDFHVYNDIIIETKMYSFQMSLFVSKMGLDLIPRLDGEVVDADSTSVVELYKVVSDILLIHSDYNFDILVYKSRV